MDIRTTPEFAQGYEWAHKRLAAGRLSTADVLALATEEARKRFAAEPRLTRDWLFVGGVWQRFADEGAPGAVRAAEAYRNWYVRQEMEPRRRPLFQVQYANVITPGPLIYLRLPAPSPKPWKRVLQALTPVMASHGLRQKDISAIEGIDPDYTPGEAAFVTILDAAFQGDPTRLSKFWLYEWVDGAFSLVREPTL